jgi:hypothetical protein
MIARVSCESTFDDIIADEGEGYEYNCADDGWEV